MANNVDEEYLFDPAILNELQLSDWPKTDFPDSITLLSPGEGLRMRPSKRGDNERGFLSILKQLTAVGDVSQKDFQEKFDIMKKIPNTYYIVVIEDLNKGEVIGTATLLVEQKFIHDCATRERIEDVVVSDEYRGKQLGKVLITTLVALSKFFKCYKLSLDCRDQMLPFYGTLGFVKEPNKGNFMCIRF